MCQNEHDRLTREFEQLAYKLADGPDSVQLREVSRWMESFKHEMALFEHAVRLANIYKSRGILRIHTGALIREIDMSDKRVNVNTGGGDITGAAIGSGADLTAQIIQSIKGNTGSTGNVNAEGQKLFESAADEIGAHAMDVDEKNAALADLKTLKDEAEKAKPKPGALKRAWGALSSVVGHLPTVVSIGKWIAEKFPDVFGTR